MLAAVVAFVALLTPALFPSRSANALTVPNAYSIDLGYQVNKGQVVPNYDLVEFRNIRFASPPVGPLRFRSPILPPRNRTGIQDVADVVCPQAYPKWLTTGAVTPFTPADIPPVDPRTSEDCLFLDVLLPKALWKKRRRTRSPVLVWIHGGGFDIGWKDASGKGYGLVTRSQGTDSQGVILVSMNYRLGLFGWMSGPDVTSNAGLADQRFALDWVQQHIHLFGGDPTRVTILGESSGASSVEAHITAYGGTRRTSPFKRAIAQSSYYLPTYPLPNSQIEAVLRFGKITSVESLRNMPSPGLQELNALIVGNSQPFGTFTFGIVPDNDYVPNLPSKLLQQGRFDRTLSVMASHNQDEGSRFVPNTLVTSDAAFRAYLTSLITPLADNISALNQITQVLYPPIFDGSQGYTDQVQRNNLTIADAAFVCNTRAMHQASGLSQTYAYVFSAPPAVHGADLPYTFYDTGATASINVTLAEIMQRYITQFAETGSPNAPDLPKFPSAKPRPVVQNLGSDFIGPVQDEGGIKKLRERCHFWQNAPYLTKYL